MEKPGGGFEHESIGLAPWSGFFVCAYFIEEIYHTLQLFYPVSYTLRPERLSGRGLLRQAEETLEGGEGGCKRYRRQVQLVF